MHKKANNFFYSLVCIMFACLVPGCFDGDSSFTIQATYTKIRSYPNGGGVFIVSMTSEQNFSGSVQLSLTADPALHADLTQTTLTRDASVAEITIRPDDSAKIKNHTIMLWATHASKTTAVSLEVEMFDWEQSDTATVQAKSMEFIEWLRVNRPDITGLDDNDWFIYITYPQILIVEHWTFLNDDWEMRVCFHVMIPPDDWSMIRLRNRGTIDPLFAAKREYASDNGSYTIHEIPVSGYPTFFDY